MKFTKTIGLSSAVALLWSASSFAELEEVIVTALKRDQSLEEVPISVSALSSSDLDGLVLSDTADITQQIPNFQVNTWSPNLTTFNIRGVSQNNFVDVNEAPIAVYIDDVYMGTMNGISGQLFDMERVEVLRGPQGTLFGRNATGGLVHYVTKGADRDDFNFRSEFGAGSFGHTMGEIALGSHLGNPRYRHRLALRFDQADGYIEPAAASQIQATLKPTSNLGGKDSLALRYALQFDVSDKVRLDINYKISRDPKVPTGGYVYLPLGDASTSYIPPELFPVVAALTGNPDLGEPGPAESILREGFFVNHPNGTPTGVATGPLTLFDGEGDQAGKKVTQQFDGIAGTDAYAPINREGLTTFRGDSPTPHTNFSGYEGFLNRTARGSDIKVHYDDEYNNSFTYIAGYYSMDKFYTEDGDGLPAYIINFTTFMDYEQLTQEFRFSKETESESHYVAGLYWMDLDYDGGSITDGAPALGAVSQFVEGVSLDSIPQARQSFFQNTDNLALFAEGDIKVSDRFSVIFGTRLTWDQKSINYRRFVSNNGKELTAADITTGASAGDLVFAEREEFSEPNGVGRLIFNWHLGAENKHNLYLSFSRGLKSGGFNVSSNVTADNLSYKSEILTSTELGYKARFSPSFTLSTNFFTYTYDNYQAFSIFGGTPNISNADAAAQGFELDLKYTPGQFTLSFGLAQMTSDVDNIQGIGTQVPPLPPVIDFPVVIDIPVDTLNNKQLPNAPDLSFNFLFSYDWLIGSSSAWLFQIDGAWYGDQFLEVTNGDGSFQAAYSVLNFATRYKLNFGGNDDHSIELKVYLKNLTDSVYKLYNLDLGILGSTAYYAPPQSFGFSFVYGFR